MQLAPISPAITTKYVPAIAKNPQGRVDGRNRPDLRTTEMEWNYEKVVWAEDINLEVISIKMIFKVIRPMDINKE